MEFTNSYVIILFISALISLGLEVLLLPRVIYVAKKKRLLDLPNSRKKHVKPIPRLGGITFMPVLLIVTLFSIFIRSKLNLWDSLLLDSLSELLLFTCGLFIIYMLGVYDDLVSVNVKKKFLAQIFATFFIIGSGIYVKNLHGLFGIYELSPVVGIPLSVLIIVFTTNALNLIDGADGLASGLSAIAFLFYGVIFSMNQLWTYATMSFIILGILLPFFYYNFFSKRRKVFMGDTGSLTLGYLLSFMMLRLFNCEETLVFSASGFILVIFSALFIPLYDAFRVMIVRMIIKKSPFTPDRNHIHHLLIDSGLSRKKAVGIIILSGILLLFVEMALLFCFTANTVFLINILFAIFICVITVALAKSRRTAAVEITK